MEERQARWGRHRLACYKGTCPWRVVRPTRVGDGWLGEPCAGNACVTAPSTWEARGAVLSWEVVAHGGARQPLERTLSPVGC